MQRPALLLVAALLLSCGAAVSASCGFPDQGCSSGQSGRERERRDILFPGDEPDSHPISKWLTPDQIDQLNSVESADDVERLFSDVEILEPVVLTSRVLAPLGASHQHSERQPGQSRNSDVIRPVPARCKPQLQPVALKKPDHPGTIYWPVCISLNRCGGCCVNDQQQSCQPTRTKTVIVQVDRFRIVKQSMMRNGTEKLIMEEHVECKCDCILKAENCNMLQEYSPRECRCNCGNGDEKKKCIADPLKLWDNNDCQCRCRDIPSQGCTTGLYFNPATCTCTKFPEHRNPVGRFDYKTEKRRRRWQNKTTNPLESPLT